MSSSDKKPNLGAAYALETPDDNKVLYAEWAKTYDTEFALDMDYQLPIHVAKIFLELNDGDAPILDVGAGTGLVGEYLAGKIAGDIDALDISPEMLATAASKKVYRACLVEDLTSQLSIPSQNYGAVISSGTFTHGHVGPDALDELLRIAKPGALFVLSVNAEHFGNRGFEAKFAGLSDLIAQYRIYPVSIYGDKARDDHRNDLGNIVTFRKTFSLSG